VSVDGRFLLSADDPDSTFASGGCGYLVDEGTILSDDFTVDAQEGRFPGNAAEK